MKLEENGLLLRIFVSEKDRHSGKPLYEWIAREAKSRGLAGLTVLRGMEGFGARGEIHGSKILDMSFDLPIIIHIIDQPERIEEFLPVLDGVIGDGLVTVEPVYMKQYRLDKN